MKNEQNKAKRDKWIHIYMDYAGYFHFYVSVCKRGFTSGTT